ncbi:uncharacterized protein LOC135823319 [Sycon ciliatum]|uniref:uncharacterized protein LOC135823319 n=1 Tax=Sycon ciliatum TaxID=27933 RepID=UPI0031F62220
MKSGYLVPLWLLAALSTLALDCCVLHCNASGDSSYNAASRFAITQKAINSAAVGAHRILEHEVRRLTFKEVSGRASLVIADVDYSLSHIIINHIELSRLAITIVDNKVGLQLAASGSMKLNSKFSYHSDGSLGVADAGVIHMSIDNFDIELEFKIDVKAGGDQMDNDGHIVTRINHPQTKVKIQKVNVDIEGHGEAFYKILPLNEIIRVELEQQLKDHLLTSLQGGILNQAFQHVYVGRPNQGKICLNQALTREEPEYRHKQFIDFFLEGNYIDCGYPKPACAANMCPKMPALDETGTLEHMFYSGFTNESYHSLIQKLVQHYYSHIELTKRENRRDLEDFKPVLGNDLTGLKATVVHPNDTIVLFQAPASQDATMLITVPINLEFTTAGRQPDKADTTHSLNVTVTVSASKFNGTDGYITYPKHRETYQRIWPFLNSIQVQCTGDKTSSVQIMKACDQISKMNDASDKGNLWKKIKTMAQDIMKERFDLHTMKSYDIQVKNIQPKIYDGYFQFSYDAHLLTD